MWCMYPETAAFHTFVNLQPWLTPHAIMCKSLGMQLAQDKPNLRCVHGVARWDAAVQ